MQFDYFRVITSADSIDIEDIGNCCIRAFNDAGAEFILIIESSLGQCRIFNYGPIMVDIDTLPKNVGCFYQRMAFNQPKVAKIIRDFLNNSKYNITQVELIDKEEALKDCRSIIEYMKQNILF
jgi:hypothetical protein